MQTLKNRKAKATALVKVVVVDPFQSGLIPLAVDPTDLAGLHKLLDCDLFDSHRLSETAVLWVDECACFREPALYPRFVIQDDKANQFSVVGYGLLTGPLDSDGRITPFDITPYMLKALAEIIEFEPWQKRLDPYCYLNQLFRIYPNP